MKKRLLLLLLTIFSVTFMRDAHAFTKSRYQVVAGSNIALKVPSTFKQATRFSGLLDAKRRMAIVAAQFPAAQYEKLKESFSKAQLAQKLLRVDEVSKLPGRQDEHLFVRGVQRTPAGDYAKFILVFRSTQLTAMVNINLPQEKLQKYPELSAEIREILQLARVARTAKTAALPFELSYLGPFTLSNKQTGIARTYSAVLKNGKKTSSALLVLSPSVHKKKVMALSPLSRKILTKLSIVKNVQIFSARSFQSQSGEGLEMLSHAKAKGSGKRVFVYQYIQPIKSGGYMRLLGIGEIDSATRLKVEFRKVAKSMYPANFSAK